MNNKEIIEKLKKHLSIKKDIELAHFLGINQSTLATWKKRGTISMKIILSKCGHIDLNWLLKNEETVAKHSIESQDKAHSYISGQEVFDRIQQNKRLPILLIPEKASAGYTKGFGNDLQREYRIMQFMDYKDGNRYRCFEIQGDSMESSNSTNSIQSGDYVLCEKIDDKQSLKDGIVYILCTLEGIVCKRLEIQNEQLILHSENHKYSPKTIDKEEVREFWRVLWVHRKLK